MTDIDRFYELLKMADELMNRLEFLVRAMKEIELRCRYGNINNIYHTI